MATEGMPVTTPRELVEPVNDVSALLCWKSVLVGAYGTLYEAVTERRRTW